MQRFYPHSTFKIAGVIAAGLVLATAGSASAEQISVNGNLTNVMGPVQTGTNAASFGAGRNTTASLSFTIPSGAFGNDADMLAGSSNPVDFSTQINGTVAPVPVFGSTDATLNASKSFDSGMAVADFLLGNISSFTAFNDVTLDSAVGTSDVTDGIAQVIDQTYSSDDHNLSTLTGGTLLLAGNSNLGGLNLDSQLTDGSGTVSASGNVDMTGGDTGNDNGGNTGGNNGMDGGDTGMDGGDTGMDGGDTGMDGGNTGGDMGGNTGGNTGGTPTDVPAPSGFGMALLMALGIGGLTLTRRRKNASATPRLAA